MLSWEETDESTAQSWRGRDPSTYTRTAEISSQGRRNYTISRYMTDEGAADKAAVQQVSEG